MTKILDLANDFSTFYKKYNNEIIEHVLVENSVIDGGIIGNTAISTADILIDNTTIRFATTRVLQPDDLLTYDETQFKFINKSVAELGFVTPDTLTDLTPNTIVANTISVTGDLIVSGNTTTLDTQTLLVEDNIVVFGSNNVADITDLGFAVKYSDGSDKYAGIFRDATDKKFYVFQNYNLEPPTATLTGFNTSTMLGTLYGDFEANNLIANVSTLEHTTANNVTITTLFSNESTLENTTANNATITTLDVTNSTLENTTANNATITTLLSNESTLENTTANNATITSLNSTSATIQTLEATSINAVSYSNVDYNNLINKPDAQLQAIADDAFVNSIIFG